ncbi:MAG: MBL fold metallo-hydrolase [Chloroflexota bacterium]
MQQATKNVFVESGLNICNLGLVVTSAGTVIIDTPSRPTNALKWRDEVGKKGEVQYVIVTEEHPDHFQTAGYFGGTMIASRETRDKLAKTPRQEVIDRLKRNEADLPLLDAYRIRLPEISFAGNLEVHVGDHTFQLFAVPGHSPGGIAVYVPEEKVVFATDCIFSHMKTWMQEANPDQWLESLRKIGELDAATVIPGHGEICTKDYLKEQAGIISGWVSEVKNAIKKGLSEEEAFARIKQPDPYPKQPGLSFEEDQLNRWNIARLYQLYGKG